MKWEVWIWNKIYKTNEEEPKRTDERTVGPKYERCQISNLITVERLEEAVQKQDAERKRSTDRTVEGR